MPFSRIRSALAGALIALTLAAGPARGQEHSSEAFVDHFGIIDARRWYVSDGWSNGAWAANDWRRSQVYRTDRGLALALARQRGEAKPFTSGEIQTHRLFVYGYFEARMRAPREPGLVTGFFTFARPGGEDSWDEIDIEILGHSTRYVQFAYFRAGRQHAVRLPLGFDAAAATHAYGFEWTPERIRWYVDGRLMHEVRGEERVPHAPQRLYVNLWHSSTLTSWLGIIPRLQPGPWELQVSCVAYAERYPGRPLCR